MNRRGRRVRAQNCFITTWRDTVGRTYGMTGPSERVIQAVAGSANRYRSGR